MMLPARDHHDGSHPRSAVPDVLAPDLDVVFCGINPGHRSAAKALISPTRGTTPGACSTPPASRRGCLDPRSRRSSSYGSGSPTPRDRTTRGSSTCGATSKGAPSGSSASRASSATRDRLRRQGGLSRPVRRPARARAAGAAAGRDAPLRPALHVTRERGRALGGAAALVSRAASAPRMSSSGCVRLWHARRGPPARDQHRLPQADRDACPSLDRRVAGAHGRRDVSPERQRRLHAARPGRPRARARGRDRGRDGARRSEVMTRTGQELARVVEANPFRSSIPRRSSSGFSPRRSSSVSSSSATSAVPPGRADGRGPRGLRQRAERPGRGRS